MEGRGGDFNSVWIRRFAGFSGLVLASSGNSSCGLTRSGLGEGFNGESLA